MSRLLSGPFAVIYRIDLTFTFLTVSGTERLDGCASAVTAGRKGALTIYLGALG